MINLRGVSTKLYLDLCKHTRNLVLVTFGNFAKLNSARPILQIPNCTRHRMITYTNCKNEFYHLKD